MSKHIQFIVPDDFPLTSLQVKEIMIRGGKLFELMSFTPEASTYLDDDDRRKLKAAIASW